MKVAALIAASGKGLRMGGDIKKQYLALDGMPILARALEPFINYQAVGQIVVIVPESDLDLARDTIEPFCSLEKIIFVEGGKRRQDSVYLGLQALSQDVEMVCIHDGVRPFVTGELLESVLKAASKYGAAIPVIPVTDTLKELYPGGAVKRTIPRERVCRAQTPQVFRYSLILQAYQKARSLGVEATDDAYLLELMGEEVHTVPGSAVNIKVTHPHDLLLASFYLGGGKSCLE